MFGDVRGPTLRPPGAAPGPVRVARNPSQFACFLMDSVGAHEGILGLGRFYGHSDRCSESRVCKSIASHPPLCVCDGGISFFLYGRFAGVFGPLFFPRRGPPRSRRWRARAPSAAGWCATGAASPPFPPDPRGLAPPRPVRSRVPPSAPRRAAGRRAQPWASRCAPSASCACARCGAEKAAPEAAAPPRRWRWPSSGCAGEGGGVQCQARE